MKRVGPSLWRKNILQVTTAANTVPVNSDRRGQGLVLLCVVRGTETRVN